MTDTPLTAAGLHRVRDHILGLDEPAAWDGAELERRREVWDLALTAAESTMLEKLTGEATDRFGLWSSPGTGLEEWRGLSAPPAPFFALEGGVGIARLRNLPTRPGNADLVAFLLSDRAANIHGADFVIDGCTLKAA